MIFVCAWPWSSIFEFPIQIQDTRLFSGLFFFSICINTRDGRIKIRHNYSFCLIPRHIYNRLRKTTSTLLPATWLLKNQNNTKQNHISFFFVIFFLTIYPMRNIWSNYCILKSLRITIFFKKSFNMRRIKIILLSLYWPIILISAR